MSEAKIGHGCTFRKGDGGSPQQFTPLAEVVTITPPGLTRDAVEATHMQSEEAWREFIKGLKDGGEVSIELHFVPSGNTYSAVLADFAEDDVIATWQLMFRDGSTFTFAAIVTNASPEVPLDDRMMLTVAFKVSGKPSFVEA